MDALQPNLRFIEASRLDTAAGRLGNGVAVVTPANQSLGKLEGVVVDPGWQRVRYLVVASRSWFSSRRYLVPLSTARLTDDGHAIQVDVDPEELTLVGANDSTRPPDFFEADFHAESGGRSQAA